MRSFIRALLAIGIVTSALGYPTIYNDTNVQLNQWTYQYTAAKAKAKALNRPMMIAFVNQGVCGYCAKWDANILSNSDGRWNTFLAQNPMILVWVDQQKQSLYSRPTWSALILGNGIWSQVTAYPEIVLLNPDGSKADQFVGRNSLGANPTFYTRVKATTDRYPVTPVTSAGTIGFSAATASAGENAGSVTVTVTRQNGSAGAQTVSYATANGTALAGVNYTAKSGTLTWTDGDAASKSFTVSLINDAVWSSPVRRTFTVALAKTSGDATLGTSTLTVTLSEDDPAPVSLPTFVSPTPSDGAVVSATVNSSVSIQTHADSTASVTYSATGLPAGVTISSGTGLISGAPSLAGDYAVTVTALNSQGPVSTAFTLRVQAQVQIQKPVGKFGGYLYEGDGLTVRGTLTLTASSTGKVQARLVQGSASYSLSTTWASGAAGGAYTARFTTRTGLVLAISVDAEGVVTGTFSDLAVAGRKIETSQLSGFAGYYTVRLGVTDATTTSADIDNSPEGYGYLTFTLSAAGTAKYAGLLADDTKVSGSADVAVYTGEQLAALGYTDAVAGHAYAGFPVYKVLYSRRGAVAGMIWIDAQSWSTLSDNEVSVSGSEWLYPGRSAKLPDDGFTATFDDLGFTPVGAFFSDAEDLSASFEDATFYAADEAVAVVGSGAAISLEDDNALNANLRVSSRTGLISGSMRIPSADGDGVTAAKYKGVLVPALSIGGGFYLESDPSAEGYRLKRSRAVLITCE